jgi:signal transduction histidine kinase
MTMNPKILIFERNIALGLDITWKLGHLGWAVTWMKDLDQISEAMQKVQVVLYNFVFAEQFPEFSIHLRYFEEHHIPIGIIPNSMQRLTSTTRSNQHIQLDYPFTLPNLSDVLENLLSQSRQKKDLIEKLTSLKRTDQIRSQTIHATVHEIRTPMSIILIAVDYVEKLLKNLKIDELEIYQIRAAFQEIQEIINVLEQAELDHLYLNKPYCNILDIYSLCKHSVSNFCLSLPIKEQIQTRISIQASQPEIFALVDVNLFRRIIKNLISNAIKFSPNHQDIKIILEIIGEEVKLSIYDRGIGIHPDDLNHITEPFYRSQNAKVFSGSGLGLSIVEACVSAQEGRLEIQSQLGIGTCVSVFFQTGPGRI